MRFEIERREGAGLREREGREALRRELALLGHAVVERDGEHRVAAEELAMGVEARRALRVPPGGRVAELRRWSESDASALGRFAEQLTGIDLAERWLVLWLSGDGDACTLELEQRARERLVRRGAVVVELGREHSAWCVGGDRGLCEHAIDVEGQRRLLACADLAFLAASRLQRDPALVAEVCAHGVIPWLGGGPVRSTLFRALEGELGPEDAARLGEALVDCDQLGAQLAWRERALAAGSGSGCAAACASASTGACARAVSRIARARWRRCAEAHARSSGPRIARATRGVRAAPLRRVRARVRAR
ncbi:MAG: hypothetical protein IPN34_03895 [Planctomycetes bacterium]|nr:hypothetical protein [Planctomycetota bacterium]